MKHPTTSFFSVITILFAVVFLAACSNSDDDPFFAANPNQPVSNPPSDTPDIVDTAVAAGDFNTLVTALQAAGLVEALRGPGPFTVFAPTDAAFSAIPPSALNGLLNDPDKAPLTDILKYHVFDGEVRASDALMLVGQSVAMVNGDLLALDEVSGDLVLNDGGASPATVTVTDIVASNGVIHVIDAVLNPQDGKSHIVDKLVNLGQFSTLIAAAQAAGLDGALSSPGTLTVFAPTDAAFGALPPGTVTALLGNIPVLTDILQYHVLGSEVFAVDAIAADGSSVTTLNTDDITIDVINGQVVLNLGGVSPATVIVTDYIATNGVVHVIDTVLDPNDAP